MKLVIIGAGGHGRVVADCAQQLKHYQEIVFLDECFPNSKHDCEWPIIGSMSDVAAHLENSTFIVAIGNNQIRGKILKQLVHAGANIATLVHPSAVISPNAELKKGTIVCANAVVSVGCTIGDGCIINTGATVDHDCKLESYVHISPGVNVAGGVTIGKHSWLGIASTVIECIVIAPNCQVGAGAAVIHSTQENSLYLGVPAKRIRALKNI
ncbi:acetyltransferase [Colwellia sp. KU-HH00111]|uniref:acetyltransferase n=1 Tax=Colwellia sp. KU-HH00111 TaxID=3127652 RepID=UPI003109521D